MLRMFAFIQCDLCSGVLKQITVAADPRQDGFESDQSRLLEELHQLRLAVEEHGWQALKDSTVHYCVDCCRV